ncbi:MAG TPA: hypothetical protein VHO06_05505, partial [Polyangia bacterium]|nr:hypothetical protein [Polyangia bacterium]
VHPLCDAIAAEIGPQKAYQDLQYNPAWTDADVRADCLAARPEAGACDDIDAGMMNTCDPSTFSALPATCTATVSDYGACLSAIGPDYDSYAGAAPTCATLTVAGLRAYFATDGGGSLGPASPAPCLTFSTGGACAGTPMPGGGSKK